MSAEKKKELQVAALENGTAIDHIPPIIQGSLFTGTGENEQYDHDRQ